MGVSLILYPFNSTILVGYTLTPMSSLRVCSLLDNDPWYEFHLKSNKKVDFYPYDFSCHDCISMHVLPGKSL